MEIIYFFHNPYNDNTSVIMKTLCINPMMIHFIEILLQVPLNYSDDTLWD